MSKTQQNNAVAITGCGWVTPYGAGTPNEVFDKLVLNLSHPTHDPPVHERNGLRISDELLDEYPDLPKAARSDKEARMSAIAIEHACGQAGLDHSTCISERTGLVYGYALAGLPGMIQFATEVRDQSPRFVSPIHFPQTVGNYNAGTLARCFGLRGPNLTFSSGPSSGLDAIAEAFALLQSGKAEVVFAGGTDILTDEIACALHQPDRTLSEGACWFVLETLENTLSRNAKPLATITSVNHNIELNQLDQDNAILSSASIKIPGAIFIEHSVGHSLAASAPAAIAAAIHAAQQNAVPVLNKTPELNMKIEKIDVESFRKPDGSIPAIVITENDHTNTVIEISII